MSDLVFEFRGIKAAFNCSSHGNAGVISQQGEKKPTQPFIVNKFLLDRGFL